MFSADTEEEKKGASQSFEQAYEKSRVGGVKKGCSKRRPSFCVRAEKKGGKRALSLPTDCPHQKRVPACLIGEKGPKKSLKGDYPSRQVQGEKRGGKQADGSAVRKGSLRWFSGKKKRE